MVWGVISAFGKTELVLFKGRHQCQKYIQMLKDHLLPFVETKEHEFQQDNAQNPKFAGKGWPNGLRYCMWS